MLFENLFKNYKYNIVDRISPANFDVEMEYEIGIQTG